MDGLFVGVNDDVPQSVYVCVWDEASHRARWKLKEKKSMPSFFFGRNIFYFLSESIENGIRGTFFACRFSSTRIAGTAQMPANKRKANFNETRLLYLHKCIWRKKTYDVGKTLKKWILFCLCSI